MRYLRLTAIPAAAVAVLLAAFALAACTSDDATPDTGENGTATAVPAPSETAISGNQLPVAGSLEAATRPGPLAVGVTTFDLVDTTRPTSPNGDFSGSDERRLTVEAWYPAVPNGDDDGRDAALDDEYAPYPLIVFAHGLSSIRTQSTSYARHLASHGYIVVSPDFPLTRTGSPGGVRFTDVVNQPGDVSFVIDSMIEFARDPGHLFENAIDEDTIGMTGHSLGGYTTLLAVYGSNRDERIDAALPLSASGCFLTEEMVGEINVPIMLMTGSEDLIVAPAGNRIAYDLANAPRYWVELIGANHVRFADFDLDDERVIAGVERIVGERSGEVSGACERPEPSGAETITLERQQELLRMFATPFFDAFLRDSDEARRFLEDELPQLTKGSARYEFDVD